MQLHVVKSLFRKEFVSYFSNPTGYVFITLFVFLSGLAAFWSPSFFDRNLANLDQLNAWYGVMLLFLVPAITMASWAEERKQGTDELLMTLPASDWDLVVGKYLGCVAIYAVCLLFASSHILVLFFLGRPDIGLMLSTYLGYLLAGAALVGVGLAASSLSKSATISFIAGAVVCGLFIAIGSLPTVFSSGPLVDLLASIALPRRLESLNRGVVDPADLAYFLGVALLGIGLSVTVISARRSAGRAMPASERLHFPLRGLSLIAILITGVILLDRTAIRADATAERLWSLSPQTRELIRTLPEDRSLAITAFVSAKVPESYVQQRETLLGLLREITSLSGGRIQAKVVEAEPNTPEARDAERAFGIKPRTLPSETQLGAIDTVFLGFAVTGGGQQQAVTEFLGRGLSAEYELARAIRATSSPKRKRVGVLESPAELFGAFNFQTFQQGRDWPIVGELRKQYDVVKVNPATDVPADIDVLMVAQPTALKAEDQKRLISYIKSGRPTLILEDPMPLVKPDIASGERTLPRNPMMGQAPPEPKPSAQPLWELLGARVSPDFIVWDTSNPHPALGETPPEFIWAARSGAARKGTYEPFNDSSPISSGLQECVLLFPGRIERLDPKAEKSTLPDFVSLIKSPPTSRQMAYQGLITKGPFGMGGGLNPARRPTGEPRSQTMAARITGGADKLNVILVADLDAFSETFFNIREAGALNLEFDNVTFVLNCIDNLAAEESLVDLRKRRRLFRTLEKIEQRRQDEAQHTLTAVDAAEADADSKIAEAKKRFEDSVAAIEKNNELDETTKRIQMESVRQAEQRKLDAASALIEDQKRRTIEDLRLTTKREIDRIQNAIRIGAVALPPIPALAIGAIVFLRRRAQASAAYARLV